MAVGACTLSRSIWRGISNLTIYPLLNNGDIKAAILRYSTTHLEDTYHCTYSTSTARCLWTMIVSSTCERSTASVCQPSSPGAPPSVYSDNELRYHITRADVLQAPVIPTLQTSEEAASLGSRDCLHPRPTTAVSRTPYRTDLHCSIIESFHGCGHPVSRHSRSIIVATPSYGSLHLVLYIYPVQWLHGAETTYSMNSCRDGSPRPAS